MSKFHLRELVKYNGEYYKVTKVYWEEPWGVRFISFYEIESGKKTNRVPEVVLQKVTPCAGDSIILLSSGCKYKIEATSYDSVLIDGLWIPISHAYVVDRPSVRKYVKVQFDGCYKLYEYLVRDNLEVKVGDRVVVTNGLNTPDKFRVPKVVEVCFGENKRATKQIVDVVDQSKYLEWVAREEQRKIKEENEKRRLDLKSKHDALRKELEKLERELEELR